eukprot:SAG11_NODE_191_length_12943_cov_3.853706_3_plen_135_part_00
MAVEQDKKEADARRAAKITEAAAVMEAAKLDYEHLTHKNEISVHGARIAFAEKEHQQTVKKHENNLQNLQSKKFWKKSSKQAHVKKKEAMVQAANERGIELSHKDAKKKKRVKKQLVVNEVEQAEREKEERLAK